MPNRWGYRFQKLVARHPLAVSASTVAIVSVLTATAAALWQAHRAEQERDRTQARLTDVRRMANTLIFDVYDQVENSQNATPIRRALVEKGVGYLDRLATDATSNAASSLELAEAYRRLAEVQGAIGRSNLGDRQGALSSLEKGRALLSALRARGNVPVEIELMDLRLVRMRASILSQVDVDQARRLTSETIERSSALLSRYPERSDVLEALGHAYFFAALVTVPGGELPLWTEANRVYRQLIERLPDDPIHLRSLALTEKYIGAIHQSGKRRDLARASYDRALALDRRVDALRPNNRQTRIDLAIDLGNLASTLWESDPPALSEAARLYRESLVLRERAAADDPQDVYARQALGFCLMQLCDLSRQMGDLDAAIGYGRRAVDAYESLLPSENLARRGSAWLQLGRAEREAGKTDEGCRALRRAHEYFAKAAAASNIGGVEVEPAAVAAVNTALQGCS
jgi:tetratricopeptide (TPR) repeat protein